MIQIIKNAENLLFWYPYHCQLCMAQFDELPEVTNEDGAYKICSEYTKNVEDNQADKLLTS